MLDGLLPQLCTTTSSLELHRAPPELQHRRRSARVVQEVDAQEVAVAAVVDLRTLGVGTADEFLEAGLCGCGERDGIGNAPVTRYSVVHVDGPA